MDSPHTGYNELVYIQTDKVRVTIKGNAAHPNFQNVEYEDGESVFKVFCHDKFDLSIKGCLTPTIESVNGGVYTGLYALKPMFFEQQRYELFIEAADGHTVSFWHDNINIRNKVTKASRYHEIYAGVINFGNEIGLSDLVIKVDGLNYLRLVIEVFPTKISYKEDYQSMVADVTQEVYNLVFDFLKKTYHGYQQSDRVGSSPVEFFAVISKIYADMVKAADIILTQPYHVLETTYEVLPGYKIKRTDERTLRWIEKHADQAKLSTGIVSVSRALAMKKQVTYNTKENRLIKYILLSTIKKLESFRRNYLRLQRGEDRSVIDKIDNMIKGLHRRSDASILKNVSALEASYGMSLVFSMAPGYRDIYKYYLMLLRGLSIAGDVFHLSVKDIAVLYEYWCYIKLNSMMKERYELVSQDIIKVQGQGLVVSLVKGEGSRVKYRNPVNGESITLSYNRKLNDMPTVTQRPDNILTLEKKGADVQYEYVFDAKYRINPALPGTDYYKSISQKPGPEIDDINTMHRYRDAIVYQNDASPFERAMFGAYVLFPYDNEEEYRSHRFYESIEKVNIGGLPFLPSATRLVSDMLDELISDSPESAFERVTLPRGIEQKLAKIDWSVRDVLVGALSSREQLNACLQNKFYHIPMSRVSNANLPIRYIAIYQSKKLFGTDAGISYYGEVTMCVPTPRREIKEIPRDSDEMYYRFEIKEWRQLSKAIAPKEIRVTNFYTDLFLLEHCSEMPELLLRSEEEYRLYSELKRAVNDISINDDDKEVGFKFNNVFVVFENGKILVYKNQGILAVYDVKDFTRSPNAVFRRIRKDILCF